MSNSWKSLHSALGLMQLACVCLLLLGAQGNALRFEVQVSSWSACTRINETEACYRTRQAVCVRTTGNVTAPWYYCTERSLQRPHTVEKCSEESCAQHCAVALWSSWSECNCEVSLYRNRTRDIVIPPRNGGNPCPSLFEQEACPSCLSHLPFDRLPRRHSWRVSDWGTCQPLNLSSGCGHGVRNRTVQCVDMEGKVVDSNNCLEEPAYRRVLPPAISQLCNVACPCLLGQWSPWSSCTPVCNTTTPHTIETRTRPILQQPTMGQTCSATVETRMCTSNSVATCPTYTWEMSGWTPCQFQVDATCGIGHRTRYVYCIESTNGTSTVVDAQNCPENSRPSDFERCESPCPQQCVVGEWSEWTACPKACVLFYSNRTRPIVLQPQGDVPPCPHLVELQECPQLPCASWMTGDYSECFTSQCGPGTQSRQVFCVNAEGTTIPDEHCIHIRPIPTRSQSCYIPCPNDCVLSEWSEWSECTQTCGGIAGNQTRTRAIAAYNSSCPFTEADLAETRLCVEQRPCEGNAFYVVQSSWSECLEGEIYPGSGENPTSSLMQTPEYGYSSRCEMGVQNQTAVCMKGDQVVPMEECPFEITPLEIRSCKFSCESECVYSDWSAYSPYSVTCGRGQKTRYRRLLQFPESLDMDCGVDGNGIQTEIEACDMPTCTNRRYEWHETQWSNCNLFPNVLSKLSQGSHNAVTNTACGTGYQYRTVSCLNLEDNTNVDAEYCRGLEESEPKSMRTCSVRCRDRCIVTDWSEYGICNENGLKTRTREIVPFLEFNNWTLSCPELFSISRQESVQCQQTDFSEYTFALFTLFGNCIVESPYETCGNGLEFRNIQCIHVGNRNQAVDEEFCYSAGSTPQENQRNCNVKCQRDCVHSEWSDWGPCSTTCGRGVRSRTRTIETEPLERGRECGHLEEFDVCESDVTCPYGEFVPGRYGSCTLNNASALCGNGTRTREPICLVNGVERDRVECEQLGAVVSFDLSEPCRLACPGECAVSDWDEWSPCDIGCSHGFCQRLRRRTLLRNGGENSADCPMLFEIQTCPSEADNFQWMVHDWLNCTLQDSSDDETLNRGFYCGNGTQQRIVECIESQSGRPVHDRLCQDMEKPSSIQMCTVPCPVDCQVSAFSEWSPDCPASCDEIQYEQSRRREILVAPQNGGQGCPELYETRPCPRADCDSYAFETHDASCSPDFTSLGQCGRGVMSQPHSCRRNGVFVEVEECLNAKRNGKTVEGLDDDFDPTAITQCDLPCPREPNCTFSEWSSTSECMSICTEPNIGFNYRQRYLLTSVDRHTAMCHKKQYEQNRCTLETDTNLPTTETPVNDTSAIVPLQSDPINENCVSVSWETSPWRPDNTRDVTCQSKTGVVLSSGCHETIRPESEEVPCNPLTCPQYSQCSQRSQRCVCSPSFEMVGDQCLPLDGCSDDGHCLLPNHVCEGGACVCKTGFVLQNGNCISEQPSVTTPAIPTGSDASSVSMGTGDVPMTTPPGTVTTKKIPGETTPTEGTSDGESSFGILPIALISAIPLLVVIIAAFFLIIITYRCRRNLEKKHQEEIAEVKRRTISISSPSPTPQTAEEMMARSRSRNGAESASSGFVDDMENGWGKFGMAGKTFLGSQQIDGQDIDEAAFPASTDDVFPPASPSHRHLYPVPVPGPTMPGGSYGHPHPPPPGEDDLRSYQMQIGAPFITDYRGDVDATTTDAYTTDDGSIVTTSVPPSSVGSPNIPRKGAAMHMMMPEHLQHNRSISQGTYVEMHPHPIYSEVRRDRYRHQRERSHDWERRSHDRSREHFDDQRSLSPTSPRHDPHQPFSYPPSRNSNHRIRERGEMRDTRAKMTAGLDHSLIQAVSQMQEGSHTPSAASHTSSPGSRRSHRRRRRRQQSTPNEYHMTYHHPNRPRPRDHYARHHSEGDNAQYKISDHDDYPINGGHPPSVNGGYPHYQYHNHHQDYTDGMMPPHVQIQPASPHYTDQHLPPPPPPMMMMNGENIVSSPSVMHPPPQGESTPVSAHRLTVTHPKYSHYDYPRSTAPYTQPIDTNTSTYASPQALNVPLPPSPHSPQTITSPYVFPTTRSDVSNASSSTTYAPPSIHSDTTSSQPSSPYAVRHQQYPPSPLVLHSNSSSTSNTTPRTSAEVSQGLHVHFSAEGINRYPHAQPNGAPPQIVGGSSEVLGYHQ